MIEFTKDMVLECNSRRTYFLAHFISSLLTVQSNPLSDAINYLYFMYNLMRRCNIVAPITDDR